MDTWNTVGLFIGTAVVLGLGIFALVMSIRGLASGDEPDITAHAGGKSAKLGRGGLVFFVLLGGLLSIGGVGLLVLAIKSLG